MGLLSRGLPRTASLGACGCARPANDAPRDITVFQRRRFAWLDNMRAFGRMGDAPNFRDKRAKGGNPCLEQTLESYELCCLVETFPQNHVDLDDFKRTLKVRLLVRQR